MRRAFQAFLVLFGIIVIGISLAHFAVGPDVIVGGTDVNPTSNGEDRFYAGLFLCYGVALLWCARDAQDKQVYVNLLATVLFVGGIGRLLAVVLVGTPHPFYLAMLAVELVLPVLMVLAAARVAGASEYGSGPPDRVP